MAPAVLPKEHVFDMTPFHSGRRNASTDSQATMFGAGGRRRDFFVLDEDQAIGDQHIFTSLRYDAHAKSSKLNPQCCKETKSTYLFKYHFDRLKEGAGCRGWYDAQKCIKRPIDLHNRVVNAVAKYEQKNGIKSRSAGAYKVRIMLKYHGNLEIQVAEDKSPYKKPLLYPTTLEPYDIKHEAAHRHDTFKVVLDALPTTKSLHTKSKTEWRPMYDYARFSAGINSYQDPKEVLLFNCDGEIMDGSFTTPYFYRNGNWVTPHTSCGGQMGTTRRWAIDRGLAIPGIVHVDSVRPDETIWLSNAVKGFFTARFIETPDRCAAPSFRSKWSISSSSSTAVDTPISDKARSFTFMPQMPEIDDLELSPCCTREVPISPMLEPTDAQSPGSPASTVRYLDIPVRNKKPPLFRIPQFLGRPAGVSERDTPPRSPSGDFNIDPLSYSHATFCL